MSLDLYQDQVADRMATFTPTETIEPGVWDGFLRGTGMTAMKTLAKTARGAGMVAGALPVLADKAASAIGGEDTTVLSDRYFKTTGDILSSAVDYWTPNSQEVGVAGQVVGQLLSVLPLAIASPPLVALGTADIGQELIDKGVGSGKAAAVAGVQTAGMMAGIWLPILGRTAFERIAVGGIGVNVGQGLATRGASSVILAGTPAAGEFSVFDGTALTLDVLLGMAFGSLAHVLPSQRAQGAKAWEAIKGWAEGLQPSQVAAIATLREAQHLNADSLPGRPVEPVDIDAHVQRARAAIDQVLNDQPVNVDGMPPVRVEAEPARWSEALARGEEMRAEAERIATEEGIPAEPQEVAPIARAQSTDGAPGQAPEGSVSPPPRRAGGGEDPGAPSTPSGEPRDPLATEAERLVEQFPDFPIRLGDNPDGTPMTMTARQYLDAANADVVKATEDAKLFQAAAQCLLGGGS